MNESTVSLAQAVTASEAVLPARVQEALGELVGAAREGLLALSVGVGLGVFGRPRGAAGRGCIGAAALAAPEAGE